ncbi:MAG: hypothetical protein RJA98_2981 [Pseudomonadota bacterium]|jgi:predicted amidohydrolase
MTSPMTPHDSLTLALWQSPHPADVPRALAALDAVAARAAAAGAQLLLCPEMSLTGYLIDVAQVAARAEAADGPAAQAVGRLAQRHGLGIVFGFPEARADGLPYNAVQLRGPDGAAVAHYRKTHLYGDADRVRFSPGPAASQVFVWRGWRLGLLICYDVEFPEAVHALALQGADAVLVPTANMLAFDEVPQLLVPARACENRLCVAYANACGREGDTLYGGLSTVADAQGRVLAQVGRQAELLIVTLDPPTPG